MDAILSDGRLVEFKATIPNNIDQLVHQVVAMANSFGGFIIFGIEDRSLTVVGLKGDYNHLIFRLEKAINTLSSGVLFLLTHEVVNDKDVVILEVKRVESTAYYSRLETTPARQIAYKYVKDIYGTLSISKDEMRYTKVYKYMTLDVFISSLYCKSWRFFEPSKWNDKYEQRFYCANYTLPSAKGNTPQLFATCVTRVKNNEAAWKVYSHNHGLGTHCVQLELNIVELRKELRASGAQFEEKRIVYENDNVILNLHKKRKPYYNKYFNSFSLDSFLNLLSLKRDAYTYEQELRFFIIPKDGGRRNRNSTAQYKDIKINWHKVITKVRVDKQCSDAELVSIQRACFFVGINPVIKNYTFIGCSQSLQGLKDVEFERFDIDEMPGKSSITIG